MTTIFIIGITYIAVTLLFFLISSCTQVSLEVALFILLGFLCLVMIVPYFMPDEEVTVTEDEGVAVIKTVAHIDLSNRTDLELIGTDTANDVAIYKYTKPEYNVAIGDTVYLVGGAAATVVSFDAVGFSISGDSITAGMSGTAVCTEDGTQIGIISSRMNDGNYRCVWS